MTETLKVPCQPSQAINDSVWQRFRVHSLFLLSKCRPHSRTSSPRVFLLPFGYVLKASWSISLSEAHTMRYVSKNTTIPVPEVVTAFETTKRRYILMRRARGKSLRQIFPRLSEEGQKRVLQELKQLVGQMRSLPPPKPGFVGTSNMGPLYDERVHDGPLGPFEAVSEFHKCLRDGIEDASGHAALGEVIQAHEKADNVSYFTHADLAFRNILYHHSKIVAILDWETAGWYPDYWETASAFYSFFDYEDGREFIHQFLPKFEEKERIEKIRRQLFNNM